MSEIDAGTIVKTVRTDFVTTGLTDQQKKAKKLADETKKAARAQKELEKAARDARKQLDKQKRSLLKDWSRISKVMRTAGKIGTVAGLGIVGGLIAIGKSAEDSELRITGLLQKNSELFDGSYKGFEAARAAAKGLRAEFREIARTSPITASQIEDSFSSFTTELSRGGIGIKDQVALAKAAAIADIGNATKGTAARDISQLLRGRAGRDITTPALVGQTATEIAKLAKSGKIQEAAQRISKVLKPSKELEQAYANSFSGSVSSLKDSLTEAAEIGAKPLMQYLSKEARKLLKWMTKNRQQVKQIALSIGNGIVKGLKVAGRIVKTLVDNWSLISSTIKLVASVYLVNVASKMVGLVRSAQAYRAAMAAAAASGASGGKGKGGSGGIGMLGGAGIAAAGAGFLGEVLNDAVFDNGIQGGLWAALTGNQTFGTTNEQAAKNASIMAANDRIRARNAKRSQQAGTFGGGKGANSKGGGGGSGKVRRMLVDTIEVSERGTTRMMSPIVKELARAIDRAAPMTTQVGLGGLRIANGVR